jgi:hypothetical protein
MNIDRDGFEYNRVVMRRDNSGGNWLDLFFVNDERGEVKTVWHDHKWISTFEQFETGRHNSPLRKTLYLQNTRRFGGFATRAYVAEPIEGVEPTHFLFDKICPYPSAYAPNDRLYSNPKKMYKAIVLREETRLFYHATSLDEFIEHIKTYPLERTRVTGKLRAGAERAIKKLERLMQ